MQSNSANKYLFTASLVLLLVVSNNIFASSNRKILGTYRYAATNNAPHIASKATGASNNDIAYNLGFGYSEDRGMPTQICINQGATTYGGSAIGIVDLAKNYSLGEVKQQLGASASGNVDIGLFSAQGTASFLSYLEDDKYAESFIYRTNIQLKNSIYNQPTDPNISILLPSAQTLLNKSPDLFRYYCGNKYVNQINWGASLYVAVKFNFHSVADKQTFDEAASASYGNIGSLSESLSKVIDKIDKNGSISVVAYQMGGDPTKLGKILGGKGDDAPIVACSFDHLDSCDQLLNNVITYAISDTGDNFPTQVTVGSPDIPVSAAPTGKVTDDYAGLAIFNGAASQLSPDIIAARKRLAGQLTQTNKNINRANYLINFSDYLPYKEKVQNELAKLIQNKPVLEQAGYICFDQLDNCLQAEKDANNQLQPIDQDILNGPTQKIYLNQTFAINGHTSASTIFALPINDLDSDVKSAKIVKLNNLQYIGGQYAAGPDSPPTGLNIFYTPSLDITGNLVPIFNGSGSLTFQLPSTIQTEQYACVGRSCVMNNEDTHFTADVEVDLYK